MYIKWTSVALFNQVVVSSKLKWKPADQQSHISYVVISVDNIGLASDDPIVMLRHS